MIPPEGGGVGAGINELDPVELPPKHEILNPAEKAAKCGHERQAPAHAADRTRGCCSGTEPIAALDLPRPRCRTPQLANTSTTAPAPAINRALRPKRSIAAPATTGPDRLPRQLIARYQALARAKPAGGVRSPSKARPSG